MSPEFRSAMNTISPALFIEPGPDRRDRPAERVRVAHGDDLDDRAGAGLVEEESAERAAAVDVGVEEHVARVVHRRREHGPAEESRERAADRRRVSARGARVAAPAAAAAAHRDRREHVVLVGEEDALVPRGAVDERDARDVARLVDEPGIRERDRRERAAAGDGLAVPNGRAEQNPATIAQPQGSTGPPRPGEPPARVTATGTSIPSRTRTNGERCAVASGARAASATTRPKEVRTRG